MAYTGEFTKQPYEQFSISVDYFGRFPLGNGLSISSATVSAYNVTDSLDATNTVLQGTTCTVSNLKVTFGVKAGTTAKVYKITVSVVCSDSFTRFEEDLLMTVIEV